MPNGFAYFMLLIWPIVAIVLFRRLPVERALIWSILGAYLVLPPIANFDFPLVPPLDKVSIPNLMAFVICVVMLGKRVPLLPASPIGRVLMILFVVSPVATVLTNPDPVLFGIEEFGIEEFPGLRIHDSVSAVINQAIFVLPFFLARRFLTTVEAQYEILRALLLAGLGYSILMLLEVRLSPQLNIWIYGFFQHDFDQMMREGGFRPIVFLPHGLWVAFFAMMTVLAALALWRAAHVDRRAPYLLAGSYLGVVLVLCKSLGALLYAVFLAPLILFFSRKLQLRIALLLALIALLFPLLRGADLVPVEAMLEQADRINPERAQSLGFRFDNEDLLLERANEKPYFGWGGWGRNLVFDTFTNKPAVTDGRWIIVIGTYGWTGYIVEFGLLLLPLLLLAGQTWRMNSAQISPYAGALALILAINMIDMLPNATLIPFTWLLAGALLGHAEALKAGRPTEADRVSSAAPREIRPRPRTIL